jgi:hypothetical protein
LTWFASDQRIKGKVATTAVVWTDKPSYSLGESAAIFGSGFLSRSTINVEVVRPDLIVNRWNTSSDVDGNFTTTYLLDGMVGTYNVTATDGTNAATTTFTDPTFGLTSIGSAILAVIPPKNLIYGDGSTYPFSGFCFQKKMCRTSDGTIHVVTMSNAPPGTLTSKLIWSYSRDNGTAWTNVTLNSWTPAIFDSPAVCSDSAGNLYLARGAGSYTGGEYFQKALVDKSNPSNWVWNWQTEVKILTATNAYEPDILVDGNGYIHIVYFVISGSGKTTWARSTNGGSTWTFTPLSGTLFDQMVASIDRDSLNNLYVGMACYSTGTQRVAYVIKITYNGGTSWTVGSLKLINSQWSLFCQLRVLADDRIVMVYTTVNSSLQEQHHVIFRKTVNPSDINTWGPEAYIANGTRSGYCEWSLSAKDANNLYVVYSTATVHSASDIVMCTSTDGGATWSAPVFLTNNALGNRYPSTIKEMAPTDQYPTLIFRDGIFGTNPYLATGNLWFFRTPES